MSLRLPDIRKSLSPLANKIIPPKTDPRYSEKIFRLFIVVSGILLTIMVILLIWAALISSPNLDHIKFWKFDLKRLFNLGDYLTVLALFGSAIAFLIGWYFNLQQKRKEYEKDYADRIRNSAGTIIAKLEWRKESNINFFNEIQDILEETHRSSVKPIIYL